jgi:excisionase family DNA binding protein
MERFLKLSEVQAMLGVSRSTVWRWTAENGLKVVRVGGVTRIRESDLQAFLKRHETEKATSPATSSADCA